MPRKPTSQLTPRKILEVPTNEVISYLAPRKPVLRTDEKGRELKGEYRNELKFLLVQLYLQMFYRYPGHLIETKVVYLTLGISLARFRSSLIAVKKVLENVHKKTLHNIRGFGYCLATDEQLLHEVLKSQVRSLSYAFACSRLKSLPEYRVDESRESKLIQALDSGMMELHNIYASMTNDQRELVSWLLSSQILTPDFIQDELYLERADKIAEIIRANKPLN